MPRARNCADSGGSQTEDALEVCQEESGKTGACGDLDAHQDVHAQGCKNFTYVYLIDEALDVVQIWPVRHKVRPAIA